jgi:ATP-dependent HslUV protease ATP-binding subunit HslU
VKKTWENFILSFLLGKKFTNHPLYDLYSNKLHSNEIDNLELNLWNTHLDRIEKFKISDIKNYFYKESYEKLCLAIDFDEIVKKNIEERAIVCVDEFDKLVKDKNLYANSKASDEGVQNDFLPLLDGTDVPIQEGKKTQLYINTRNILFVALGAFTKCKPTDLIVEIQGRLPNVVQIKSLTKEDFILILNESEGNSLEQSIKSLQTEGIKIVFSKEAIESIAAISEEINKSDEDTGARRLVPIIDTVLEDINYHAPEICEEVGMPEKLIV